VFYLSWCAFVPSTITIRLHYITLHYIFVYVWNISGFRNRWTDLRQIRYTRVGPSLDEFECQGQWSGSPGTKNELCTPITPGSDGMVRSVAWRTVTRSLQITSCSSVRDHCVAAGGDFGDCVRFMFGKTCLALVLVHFELRCGRWQPEILIRWSTMQLSQPVGFIGPYFTLSARKRVLLIFKSNEAPRRFSDISWQTMELLLLVHCHYHAVVASMPSWPSPICYIPFTYCLA